MGDHYFHIFEYETKAVGIIIPMPVNINNDSSFQNNDLLYSLPAAKIGADCNFQGAGQQAFEAYINQDDYLKGP